MTVSADRQTAARLLAKLLATKEGRAFFADNGHRDSQPIVLAGWDDPLKDVMAEVTELRPPVMIAILRGGELVFMVMRPAAVVSDSTPASPDATIGMLYEANEQNDGGTGTYRITDWSSAALDVLPRTPHLVA